ncbi:hypothetical protein AB2L27_10225 [Kineococcus sp. LSe6-4]|uniref:Uncharacterized protein n=1 Tax=Kineococcus halophytocola TaxID=3234027 RepID=A0ABV4H0P0_9ACTN
MPDVRRQRDDAPDDVQRFVAMMLSRREFGRERIDLVVEQSPADGETDTSP